MKWAIIPIITEKENDPDFLKKFAEASKVILVFVIDPEQMGNAKISAVGEKIKIIQKLMTEIKKQLQSQSSAMVIDEKIEWGNWEEKLVNLAEMEKIDEVVFYNSVVSHQLADKLREKGIEVSVF
jgi:pentose-5-phosphate-3-epimerase